MSKSIAAISRHPVRLDYAKDGKTHTLTGTLHVVSHDGRTGSAIVQPDYVGPLSIEHGRRCLTSAIRDRRVTFDRKLQDRIDSGEIEVTL